MPTVSEKKPAAKAPVTAANNNIAVVVGGIGRALNMAALYGRTHRLTDETLDEVAKSVLPILSIHGRFFVSLTEGVLHVNGYTMDTHVPFATVLTAKLRDLDITGFTLHKGMSAGKFRNLIHTMATHTSQSPQGGFASALAKGGVTHVTPDRAVYRRVSESSAGAAAAVAGASPTTGGVSTTASSPGAPVSATDKYTIGQVLAFIKGNTSDSNAADAVRDAANSPDKLAQMIVESTVLRQTPHGIASGESLADLIVGCLRRTLDTVVTDSAAQTQESRVSVRKSLLVLEECVLAKLHKIADGPQPNIDRAISRVFRERIDELEVAAAASEYVRRHEALEKVEDWMVSYMRDKPESRQSGGRFEKKLRQAGITADDWQQLVLKSESSDTSQVPGPGSGAGGASAIPAELGALAVLLSQLDELMQGGEDQSARAAELAGSAGGKTETLQVITSGKVDTLGKTLSSKSTRPSDSAAARLLAEISQELAQPVTVINCVIDILNRGRIGAVTQKQRDMLKIARGCGTRVKDLLEQLRNVVGVPDSLTPTQVSR